MVSDRGDRGLIAVWKCSFSFNVKKFIAFLLVTAKLMGDYFYNTGTQRIVLWASPFKISFVCSVQEDQRKAGTTGYMERPES